MTTETAASDNSEEWAKVIKGIGEGAQNAMQGAAATARSRITAKEAKRRTFANLLSGAMKRDNKLFKNKKDNSEETGDTQTQALQHVARAFAQGKD